MFWAGISSIHIEGGIGYGFGASAKVGFTEVSIQAYQDTITLGLDDCETYTSISGCAEADAKLIEDLSLGISTSYEHRFETGSEQDFDEHTTVSSPWDVYTCPKTVKDELQIIIPFVKSVKGNLSKNRDFLGISSSLHLGVGFHYSIGLDLDEFVSIMKG